MPTEPPAYTCPTCGRQSWNPDDAANKYCGVCGFEDGSLRKDPLALPESPVPLNSYEIGWLMAAAVLKRAEEGDGIARTLYLKLKAAAIANGVEWYYGDPFPIDQA